MSTKDQSQDFITTFSQLMEILSKYQNELQATRELLTLRNDFNPENLFKYLTMGEEELTKAHIMYFMEENSQLLKEDEAKLLLTVYGYKEKLTYNHFLDYIFPFDVDAIKTISSINCKKYAKTDDNQPNEEVLCIFLLLIMKQSEFLHVFDELKAEKIPSITRQSLKKWIKLLKKNVPQASSGIKSDFVFTFAEFKAILKKIKNFPERKAQPICRRLSLQKDSFIGIDQLQVWLKPWFKPKQEDVIITMSHSSQTLLEDMAQGLFA